MNVYFLDSSALIKRYITEIGSIWVHSLVSPAAGNIIVVAELARIEVAATFARRQREGTLVPTLVTSLYGAFLAHLESEYLVVPIDTARLQDAVRLANRYPLRSLDAIQLACAIHARAFLAEPLTFICADPKLVSAAVAEGLPTDDPLAHP